MVAASSRAGQRKAVAGGGRVGTHTREFTEKEKNNIRLWLKSFCLQKMLEFGYVEVASHDRKEVGGVEEEEEEEIEEDRVEEHKRSLLSHYDVVHASTEGKKPQKEKKKKDDEKSVTKKTKEPDGRKKKADFTKKEHEEGCTESLLVSSFFTSGDPKTSTNPTSSGELRTITNTNTSTTSSLHFPSVPLTFSKARKTRTRGRRNSSRAETEKGYLLSSIPPHSFHSSLAGEDEEVPSANPSMVCGSRAGKSVPQESPNRFPCTFSLRKLHFCVRHWGKRVSPQFKKEEELCGGSWLGYASSVLRLRWFRYTKEDFQRYPLGVFMSPTDNRCFLPEVSKEQVYQTDILVSRLLTRKYLVGRYLLLEILNILGQAIEERSVAYGVPAFTASTVRHTRPMPSRSLSSSTVPPPPSSSSSSSWRWRAVPGVVNPYSGLPPPSTSTPSPPLPLSWSPSEVTPTSHLPSSSFSTTSSSSTSTSTSSTSVSSSSSTGKKKRQHLQKKVVEPRPHPERLVRKGKAGTRRPPPKPLRSHLFKFLPHPFSSSSTSSSISFLPESHLLMKAKEPWGDQWCARRPFQDALSPLALAGGRRREKEDKWKPVPPHSLLLCPPHPVLSPLVGKEVDQPTRKTGKTLGDRLSPKKEGHEEHAREKGRHEAELEDGLKPKTGVVVRKKKTSPWITSKTKGKKENEDVHHEKGKKKEKKKRKVKIFWLAQKVYTRLVERNPLFSVLSRRSLLVLIRSILFFILWYPIQVSSPIFSTETPTPPPSVRRMMLSKARERETKSSTRAGKGKDTPQRVSLPMEWNPAPVKEKKGKSKEKEEGRGPPLSIHVSHRSSVLPSTTSVFPDGRRAGKGGGDEVGAPPRLCTTRPPSFNVRSPFSTSSITHLRSTYPPFTPPSFTSQKRVSCDSYPPKQPRKTSHHLGLLAITCPQLEYILKKYRKTPDFMILNTEHLSHMYSWWKWMVLEENNRIAFRASKSYEI